MEDHLRKTRRRVRRKHQSYGGGELCTVAGKDSEIKEPQHLWTNDVQEPVRSSCVETLEFKVLMRDIESLRKRLLFEREEKKRG